ncbi:phenol oxidase A [Microdochium trichocladiopsis]|uniref:Phenol oxidase A n=1 Tax=Microdochium trichocladiopsis TaxID=1682393 RepID=A0A9P8YGB2_9PEZI|nr:phenol oxidase A [Microdochium trichocladiopsis]KAH7038392.1 phenol oxidase A [Microdochium trichocladiopsis]
MKEDWESPVYPLLFRNPLPIPPQKQPKMVVTNPVTGKEIWYYELEIKPFSQQIYPTLRPAQLVGYDGIAPGPTFIVPVGTETVVRILNSAKDETSVHLHGSPSRAPFDGWAEDVTFPGEYKDYYFPNYQSARFLWYHDHAMHKTAENAYLGQAGAYILHDDKEDALGLPSGYGKYDIPLVLTSRVYNADGTVKTTVGEDDSLWGDVIHVNGQPWPFLNVEPRKYRFRLLDAAVSRAWNLYFARTSSPDAKIQFQVIGSDAGLLEAPVPTREMYIANGERYEIVVDFSGMAGQTVDLRHIPQSGDIAVDDEYEHTDKVMRFVVSSTPVVDPSVVPSSLRTVPFPPDKLEQTVDHHFRFHRSNGQWLINGIGFADVENRILANVPRGTVEIWELENSSDGWSHPIHVHLVDFKVLSRTGGRTALRNTVQPYEAAGLKDVVWLGRGETVRVEAHYLPWTGVYMFHCHNLIHEDQDMMAAFDVKAVAGFGYNETTDFSDPMDERWRAVPFARSDFVGRTGPFSPESITAKVEHLAEQQPYSELGDILAALGASRRYRRFKL